MKVAKFEFSLFGINTYVVYDPATKKCAVIDPGMSDQEEEEALTGFIARNGLTVTHIINTHLHIDHAIGDRFASETFGVPVLAHPDDSFLGERLQEQARQFGIAGRIDNTTATRPLKDGEKIVIGDGELTVIHVPGHSPGGIALYDKEGGYVISGDSLFAGSIGRTDLPGGDMRQLISAVRSRLLTLPPDTVVYPGHGPATTIARERASNPFLI